MSTPARPEPVLPPLLVLNRNFVLLWAAYGISAIGDHLSEMALLVERDALEGEHATRIQALLAFGFFLPFVLLAPLAGWWADRFSRKWTMIGSDVLRAGVMLSLIWTVRPLIDWLEPHGLGDYAVVLPLTVTGALAAFFSPSRQALLPTLIRPGHLVRANSLISALGTIGGILGAVLGGLIVKYKGTTWSYSADSLTFLLSALLLSFILMSRTRAVPHPPLAGVWTPVRQGFRYVRDHHRVLQMILLGTAFWAAAGVVISVVPALVRDVFGGDIAHVAIYRGLLVGGLATGAAVMSIFGPAMPIPLATLVSLAGGTFWLFTLAAVCGFKLGAVPAGVCLVGIGGAGAGLLVTIMASIQRFVPDSRRGRVFGVSDMCTMAAIVITTGVLGVPEIPHIDIYVPWLLAATGAGLGMTTWLAWRTYCRGEPYSAVASVLWQVLRFYARFWLGARRIGPCTVPREGPVIIAANHTAGVDPIGILATCTHRPTSFLVERKYHNAAVTGWLQRLIGCTPIDRAGPAESTLASCLRLLESGGCLGIFAEGAFPVPEEELPRVGSDVGVLALRSGAVVIPCHISGAAPAHSSFASFFRRQKMELCYGKPVNLSAFRGRQDERAAVQEVDDLIRAKIRELGTRVPCGTGLRPVNGEDTRAGDED